MITTKTIFYFFLTTSVISMIACSSHDGGVINKSLDDGAKITAVECIGQPNNYTFDVTIESPDTGCDQYADWWEVFTPDSVLIYRRILTHSHVTEQPFTRSGGTVEVGADDFIYVRAHMNNLGYGTQVFSGNVREGLELDSLQTNFAISLSETDPLPQDCAF